MEEPLGPKNSNLTVPCMAWANNTATLWGPVIASSAVSLDMEGAQALGAQASDQLLPAFQVHLRDLFGQRVVLGRDSSAVVSLNPYRPASQAAVDCDANPTKCLVVLGSTMSTARGGMAVFNSSVRVRAEPGIYQLAVAATLPRIQRVLGPMIMNISVRASPSVRLFWFHAKGPRT